MQELIILSVAMLLAGCAAGIFAGLLGVGGGIIIVPLMEAMLSVIGIDDAIRMHIAVATSLAVIIPTSVSSSIAHHRRGAVDFSVVKHWALYIVAGALLGSFVAAEAQSTTLAAVFGAIAFLFGLKMIFEPELRTFKNALIYSPKTAPIPFVSGFFSSMMGIGGGTFSVMFMTMFGVPIHRAIGTSALFGLFIAIPAVIGFVIGGWNNPALPQLSFGFVNLLGFLLIAPATVLCAPLGARIAHGLSKRHLNLVFGVFLLVAALRMATRTL